MTNPFDTPVGRRARMAEFRILAASGDGVLADFAKEVVAGRAEPRDLLTTGWVVEGWIDELQAEAARFRDSPEAAEEWSLEQAHAFLDQHLAGVASLDVEAIEAALAPPPRVAPRPVEDEDEEGPPLLKDAW
ncbi:hypothetical protein SK803_21280 [Lentzea sp. BCCO 10_0856]|uniref:Uncharacterized protein n=1 Tax=Lentzea miocenica TaxID=3095431 RepID=A0ABU4T3N2_9PSEU|nr:hypothetical protein [Lentzea sp. BCCO 10_0856]MDX8032756.1 hypothetical protein [Lentzea sp. BCCO 10_0856]